MQEALALRTLPHIAQPLSSRNARGKTPATSRAERALSSIEFPLRWRQTSHKTSKHGVFLTKHTSRAEGRRPRPLHGDATRAQARNRARMPAIAVRRPDTSQTRQSPEPKRLEASPERLADSTSRHTNIWISGRTWVTTNSHGRREHGRIGQRAHDEHHLPFLLCEPPPQQWSDALFPARQTGSGSLFLEDEPFPAISPFRFLVRLSVAFLVLALRPADRADNSFCAYYTCTSGAGGYECNAWLSMRAAAAAMRTRWRRGSAASGERMDVSERRRFASGQGDPAAR